MLTNSRVSPLMAAVVVCCGALSFACSDSGSTPSGIAAGTGAAGTPVAGATGGVAGGTAGAATTGMAGRSGAAGAAGRSGTGGAGAGAAGTPAAGSGGDEDDAGVAPDAGQPTAGATGPVAGMNAPVAGMNAAGMNAADAGPDATTMEPRMDLGEGDGSDVITIGDSWMSNTLGTGDAIQGALSRLTDQPYRNYAAQGVLLLEASLFGAAIPSQYDTAKRRDPDISTVIMTGGGNDIIQNASVQASCDSGGEACKMKLAEIQAGLGRLWTQMANDGVKDVVYIQYSSDAGSTDDSVRGDAMPPEICLSGKIRCHSIASTAAVMGQLQDGIHPTRAANDRIAKVVWDYMVKEGIRR